MYEAIHFVQYSNVIPEIREIYNVSSKFIRLSVWSQIQITAQGSGIKYTAAGKLWPEQAEVDNQTLKNVIFSTYSPQ